MLHLGDDADNFLEDPEVVARAGLITERLGYFRYDGMCEKSNVTVIAVEAEPLWSPRVPGQFAIGMVKI